MKIRAVQWLASLACSLILMMTATAPADAGILNALFGCCGGGGCGPSYCAPSPCYYGPSYGGCGPSGCGTSQSYYGWSNSGYACAPCPTNCSPCAVPCGPGTSGSCNVAPGSAPAGGSIAPVPDDAWKKRQTYESNEPAPNSTNGTPPGTRTVPENRTAPETGLPSGRPRPNPLNDESDEAKSGALRIPPADGTGTETKSESGDQENPAGGKKAPATKKVPLDDEKDAKRVSPINLDEKIAWRPTVERKRLDIEPSRGNARLIRIPLYAKSDWQPVDDTTSVAKR